MLIYDSIRWYLNTCNREEELWYPKNKQQRITKKKRSGRCGRNADAYTIVCQEGIYKLLRRLYARILNAHSNDHTTTVATREQTVPDWSSFGIRDDGDEPRVCKETDGDEASTFVSQSAFLFPLLLLLPLAAWSIRARVCLCEDVFFLALFCSLSHTTRQ